MSVVGVGHIATAVARGLPLDGIFFSSPLWFLYGPPVEAIGVGHICGACAFSHASTVSGFTCSLRLAGLVLPLRVVFACLSNASFDLWGR